MHPLSTKLSHVDLARLGFRDDDAADYQRALAELTEAHLDQIADYADALRKNIGHFIEPPSPFPDDASPEEQRLALFAMAAVAEDVVAEYLRREVPEEIAWASVADLGQQVHVHRQVHGSFGLGTYGWCAENFSGHLLWLGRLQFTLETNADPQSSAPYALGVHIPESGPLTPQAVDHSLDLARSIGYAAYSDHEIGGITLSSWLLDPEIVSQLNPESNFARFAHRFDLFGEPRRSDRDGLFFGFHIEPNTQDYSLDALPQDTSLQRAIVTQLRGPGIWVHRGRLTS